MSKDLSELAAELDRVASKVTLRKGTVLFHCGDILSGVFVVRSGAVTMSVDGPNTIYPPRTIGPGEIAGLPATLTGQYSLTAVVSEDSELGFIPGPKVSEMFEISPRLCMLAMRIMSDEIARVRTALKETPPLEHEEDNGETPSQGTPSPE
ncbi:MAG TPA: Crp/Fnr family transcriptional regulator [Acidobacteriaceae bacterium]|jgi:CRP-like cAMP-binding protein|nr:Crp/Fnr family transcriptional regulator [Acidobacteriaceae bacterium]